MKLTAILLATAMLLGGCETVRFDQRGCPRIQGYTQAQMAQLAKDLEHAAPSVRGMSQDYLKLRDAVRACRRG